MYKEIFKNRLIEYRRANKLTKGDIAGILKVSYPTYLKLEAEGNFTLDQVGILCKRMGIAMLFIPDKYITNL